jgi:hypothetical protein
MKIQEVREIAKQRDIRTANMKKVDIIRTIQREEGNSDCYNTGYSDHCGQDACCWRDDCN